MKILPSTVGCLLLVRMLASATAYYISTTGSDFKSGKSTRSAWATFAHADSVVQPGDTVIVLNGTYKQSFNLTRSGTSTSPITYRAQNQYGAVIAPTGGYQSDNSIIDVSGSYITIKNFEIKDGASTSSLNNGIRQEGSSSQMSVIGNKVHHIDAGSGAPCQAGAAISPYKNAVIDSNTVYDVSPPRPGTHCYYMHAIYVQGSNTVVKNNIAYDIYQGSALTVNNANLSKDSFLNNLVFHNGTNNAGGDGVQSGGALAISCDGGGCSGLVFANNIFMDNASVGGACLGANNGGWTNVTLINNSLLNCGDDINNAPAYPWQNTILERGGDSRLTSASPTSAR